MQKNKVSYKTVELLTINLQKKRFIVLWKYRSRCCLYKFNNRWTVIIPL